MKNKLLILVLPVILLFSCVKEVDISDFEKEDKLVISSYLVADSIFKVYLSKTHPYLEKGIFYIENAELNLFDENGNLLEKLNNIDSGLYQTSSTKVETGINYKIETTYNDEIIFAEDIIPEIISVSELRNTGNFITENDSYIDFEIEISINDNPNVDNYYEINSYIKYTDTSSFLGEWYYKERYNKYKKNYLSSTDYVILNEDYSYYGIYDVTIFSDENFTNDKQIIKFYYSAYNLNNESLLLDHVLKIELRTVSKNYYLYKKSLMKHLDNQYSDFWYGVANPVQLYSNVQNGYGIFAGFSSYTDSISYTSPYKQK
ncbi:MAG: DUF4249 domain-containing protein [Bacteroidales bacterium]|nr:DUF4249 domain-containing protein [Bacteroidales bacterium]